MIKKTSNKKKIKFQEQDLQDAILAADALNA